MDYDINKLPDFYSVRDYEQINYAMEGMKNKKCFCFFDNGFCSNVIEPNKREIKFIWDGFILFVDKKITLNDIKNGCDLYDARLVALQRTNLIGKKGNTDEVRNYIINQLTELGIEFTIMKDTNFVNGYPSKSDLWSTRDQSVLLDAIDCVGDGDAYFFQNKDFSYRITFNQTNIPSFCYSHLGAIVLHGDNKKAIARLICNSKDLQAYLETIVGKETLYSYLENKNIRGTSINNLENRLHQ